MLYYEDLTGKILGALIKVHKKLGPGHYEETYQKAASHELRIRGLRFKEQVPVKINYKGIIAKRLRLDFLVESKVIVELKARKELTNIDKAQILAYLRTTNTKVGLLVNLGRKRVQIKRFVL